MRDLPERPGSHGAVLRWTERLLQVAGLAALAWCVLIVLDGVVAQHAARRALETASPAITPAAPQARVPTPTGTGGVVTPHLVVRRGDPVAELSIPRVRLSTIVLHGSDDQTLRRGPGHLEGTAFPGARGNMVIAGHRDTFFRRLRHIREGDDIFLHTTQGRFDYRVTSLRVVGPNEVSVLQQTDEAILTLITCYPFWVLGDAPDRFIVRAARVAPGAAPAVRLARPREAADDETLIRQAIERYRVAHNGSPGPGAPLTLRACDVVVTGDRATAACAGSSSRTFTLQRAARDWAIQSILVE